MTMKITRLKTARWLPQSPISHYSSKFSKPQNSQKQFRRRKKKIPNYHRNQSSISPQRWLLAQLALRDQLWPINGSHRERDHGLQYKLRTLSGPCILQRRYTHQRKHTFRDHLGLEYSSLAESTFKKNQPLLKKWVDTGSHILTRMHCHLLPITSEFFPNVLIVFWFRKFKYIFYEPVQIANPTVLNFFHFELANLNQDSPSNSWVQLSLRLPEGESLVWNAQDRA